MRTFFTKMTFPKVLIVTAIGAAYVGLVSDLPSPNAPLPPPSKPVIAHFDPNVPYRAPRLHDLSVDAAPDGSMATLDVKPLSVWQGTLPENHVDDGRPVGTVVSDLKTWRKIWVKLRGEEPPPTVDFTREVVVLGTIPGANVAALKVWRDARGHVRVTIFGSSTPSPRGSYILARFDRKTVNVTTVEQASL